LGIDKSRSVLVSTRHRIGQGKNPQTWPEDVRAYAIHSLREITPDDL
jgi:hypothetical protein